MGAPKVGLEEALLDQSDQAGLLSLASSGGPLLSNLEGAWCGSGVSPWGGGHPTAQRSPPGGVLFLINF